jgi:hypothetical protein
MACSEIVNPHLFFDNSNTDYKEAFHEVPHQRMLHKVQVIELAEEI